MPDRIESLPLRPSVARARRRMWRIACAIVIAAVGHLSPATGDEATLNAEVPKELLSKCDRYLAELYRQSDESALVDELCTRIESTWNTNDLSTLKKMPPPQKLLWDVWSAKAIIDNGGMHYFLTGDFVDYSGRANSFREIGLVGCADALERAYAAFPNSHVPDDIDERERMIDRLPDETTDEWDHITSDYFDCDGQLTLLLGEYARTNAEAFVELRGKKSSGEYAALLKKSPPTPPTNASPKEVVEWIGAIGGGSFDESHERLTHVFLGNDRRSTSEELASLAAMDVARNIEELGLESTSFKDSDAPLLLKFPRLRALHISETDVSAPTVDVIERIPTLREVWMRETNIPYSRFRELLQQKDFDEVYYGRATSHE